MRAKFSLEKSAHFFAVIKKEWAPTVNLDFLVLATMLSHSEFLFETKPVMILIKES